MRPLVALACAVALVGCGGGDGETEGPSWNHDPEDAALGPAGWGEIDESFEQCLAGEEQSPISLAGADSADLPELRFDYNLAPLIVENTGHTVEVSMPEDGGQTLAIGDDRYRLVQYHFHAPSEHIVEGRSYDAEVHLVHQSDEGELAVVGVLLEIGDEPSVLVDLVLGNAPDDAGESGEIGAVSEHDPLELLGIDSPAAVVTRYDAYSGSLTTPPCSEGVRWMVLTDTLAISSPAATSLHRLVADFPDYGGYENNNRPTQPLNDRVIQRDTG